MTAARPGRVSAGAVRSSLWRQVLAQSRPDAVAGRYVTLARLGARRADPAVFASSAREDVTRLAAALGGVLDLHTAGRRHCPACSIGPYLVDWPCQTRRAVETGLRQSWPAPADLAQVAELADLAGAAPGPHEAFALAVLAVHDVLPGAGGQPARCRACQVPPGDCPVWALAEGFLGITWTDPATSQAPAATR